MAILAENGFVASTSGADSFIYNDMIITGGVIWVDSVNGSDSNSGSEVAPLATIAQAVTNATANTGDIIIVKSGHTETLTTAITMSKAGLKIFGVGSGSSAPNITVGAAIDGFDITADDCEINNIYFPIGTTATNTSRINIGADRARIKGCTFLCGQYDLESITITSAGTNATIDSCTFTVSADGPDAAIEIESASATGLRIYSCSFDGGSGTNNFDNSAINSAVAHLNFVYDTVTLTNGAKIVHSAGAKGWISNPIAGDGSTVTV